jgi:hypothetical protein
MILVQDIHQVIARREVDFESAYRDAVPKLNGDAATFLFFAWAPHGGGEGYEAVTLSSFADGDALDHYQERLRYGDLGEWWTSVEAMRYTLHSSTHILESDPPTVETMDDHEPALYRLDQLTVSVPLAQARKEVATTLPDRPHDGILDVMAWWTPLLGDLDRPTVTVLNRIRSDEAFLEAFADPTKPWVGGVDGSYVERRDVRLLRTARWSPWE